MQEDHAESYSHLSALANLTYWKLGNLELGGIPRKLLTDLRKLLNHHFGKAGQRPPHIDRGVVYVAVFVSSRSRIVPLFTSQQVYTLDRSFIRNLQHSNPAGSPTSPVPCGQGEPTFLP